jgi:hypothetical protein
VKRFDEAHLWDEIRKILPHLPYRIELPLTMIESILWPQANEGELKFRGKILVHVLRSHGAQVVKRGGKRYVTFPRQILDEAKKKRKSKKVEKTEPEHIMVAEAWAWP